MDIISALCKNVYLKKLKYGKRLLEEIFELSKSSYEDISESAIECLRKLTFAADNEKVFIQLDDKFLVEMTNLMLHGKSEIRESVLEILYCMSDEYGFNSRFAKIPHSIHRLIGLLSSNSKDNRIQKYAACILANLATLPAVEKMVLSYEIEIFLSACLDDNLTKTLMSIISLWVCNL